jgi:phosphate-selective porin OprO and OprP
MLKRAAIVGALSLLVVLIVAPRAAVAQQPPATNNQSGGSQPAAQPATPPQTLDNELQAGDEEISTPKRDLIKWNHYDGQFYMIRAGAGFLEDFAAYSQNEASKEQFQLFPEFKVRDARFIFKGAFKFERHPVSWSSGIMYDPPTEKFLVRETGFLFTVPEISGYIFVGRTKEGFSLNKIMVGYAGWTMERTPISDATIPILADGIKWMGYAQEKHLLWNLGAFTDTFSEGQTFSTYSHQFVGRIVWLPIENNETVLHLGADTRYGAPLDGMLQLRSRPEAFEAPYFIDTGKFPAKSTQTTSFEAYYRPRSLLVGSEYFVQSVNSPAEGNPFFQGGNVVVSWLATGEIRTYNTRGGFFDQISPLRPVFQGGPGAWEFVANLSYADLDSGPIQGGKFWRFTPMVNWHVSDNVRLEIAYGYGSLRRFGLVGATQFFQTRLQLQL